MFGDRSTHIVVLNIAQTGVPLRFHPAERKTALMMDIARSKNGGQCLITRTMQKQPVAQQLRNGGVGINDLHRLTHSEPPPVIIQHQRGFNRCDTALVGYIWRFREGNGDGDTSFFYSHQFIQQSPGGLMLVELIARQHKSFGVFQPKHAACGEHQKIIRIMLAALCNNMSLF